MNVETDRHSFAERAQRLLYEGGFTEAFHDLVSNGLTFTEIKAIYGEETAINVGIARDPDAPEWTEEDWANARPASEVAPHLVGGPTGRRRGEPVVSKHATDQSGGYR
jgi:hypothetical protein